VVDAYFVEEYSVAVHTLTTPIGLLVARGQYLASTVSVALTSDHFPLQYTRNL
jgi:hypothetical protein